jgi:hypothetical protein
MEKSPLELETFAEKNVKIQNLQIMGNRLHVIKSKVHL